MAKIYDDPSTTENEDELFGGFNSDNGSSWKAIVGIITVILCVLFPAPIIMAIIIGVVIWSIFRWIHIRASVMISASAIISVISAIMFTQSFKTSELQLAIMNILAKNSEPIGNRIKDAWIQTSWLIWIGVIIGCIAGVIALTVTKNRIHNNPFLVVTKGEKYYHWRYRRTPKQLLRRYMIIKGMKEGTYKSNKDSYPIGIEEEPINPPDDPAYIKYDTPISKYASEAFTHDLITGSSGSGKDLYKNTLLPTPYGMCAIEHIKVGDTLFDENGNRTKVLAKYHPNDKHYEITFSDGTRIKAGGDHLWKVNEVGKLKHTSIPLDTMHSDEQLNSSLDVSMLNSIIIDTKTMYKNMLNNHIKNNALYSVSLAKCVDYDKQNLPIQPYTFGAWLGDGDSYNGTICGIDNEVRDNVLNENYTLQSTYIQKTDSKTKFNDLNTWSFNDLSHKLFNESGLKTYANNPKRLIKDIPDVYLISSREQRIQLLKGLLDTDGTVDNKGHIEVNMTDETVVKKMRMIVCSLGWLATKITKKTNHYKNDNGESVKGSDSFRFSFHPDCNVFTVKRKHDRLQAYLDKITSGEIKQQARYQQRYITSIKPLHDDNEDYYCLTVDSPSHLFLCSESFIPTHNTITMQNSIRHNMENRQTVFIIDCKADPNFAAKMASWSNELGLNFYHFAPTMGNEYRITQNPAGPSFYDPLAHGRATDHTDMLISIREWDAASAVYKSNAQSMLSTVFAIMDEMDTKNTSLSNIDFSRGTMYTFYELIRNESNLTNAISTIPSQSQTRLLADELETLIHATNRSREAQGVQNAMGEYKGFMRGLMTSDGRYMVYPKNSNRKIIDVFKLASEPGNVVLFSLSATKSTDVGAMVGSMICTDLTNMTAMRAISGQTNPVSIYIDEFQSLPPTAVKSMLEKARSAKIGITLAFQSLEQVTASSGTDAFINALLDTCGNFIFHAGSNETTAQTMSQIIGKHWTNQYTVQRRNQQGMFEFNWGNKRNANIMTNQVEKYIIEPSAFQHLSAPRKDNGFKSEAIVIKKASSDPVDKVTTGPVAHKVWMIPPDIIIKDDYFDPNAPIMKFDDEAPETGIDERGTNDNAFNNILAMNQQSAINTTVSNVDNDLFNDSNDSNAGSSNMSDSGSAVNNYSDDSIQSSVQSSVVRQAPSNGMPVLRRHPKIQEQQSQSDNTVDDDLFNDNAAPRRRIPTNTARKHNIPNSASSDDMFTRIENQQSLAEQSSNRIERSQQQRSPRQLNNTAAHQIKAQSQDANLPVHQQRKLGSQSPHRLSNRTPHQLQRSQQPVRRLQQQSPQQTSVAAIDDDLFNDNNAGNVVRQPSRQQLASNRITRVQRQQSSESTSSGNHHETVAPRRRSGRNSNTVAPRRRNQE